MEYHTGTEGQNELPEPLQHLHLRRPSPSWASWPASSSNVPSPSWASSLNVPHPACGVLHQQIQACHMGCVSEGTRSHATRTLRLDRDWLMHVHTSQPRLHTRQWLLTRLRHPTTEGKRAGRSTSPASSSASHTATDSFSVATRTARNSIPVPWLRIGSASGPRDEPIGSPLRDCL